MPPWLTLILPGLIWGASFLFIAEGIQATGPNAVTFARIVIGFLTLSLFPSVRKPVARKDWGLVIALGVFWFAFPLSMFPYAEQHVSSALTGMLNGANPLFATIVASLISRRLPSSGVLKGLAIGIGGAVILALPALGEGSSSAGGIWMIVAALVSYGIALSIARNLQLKYGGIPVIWRAQFVAAVLTAPLGIHEMAGAHWTLSTGMSVFALGALGTAIAPVIMSAAAGHYGAAKSSSTAFLIPVVALVLGVIVLHESVSSISLAGGAICLAGAWIMKRAA